MWPGFDSRTRRHMWVEFVVGSRPCSEGFSPGSPFFLLPQKPTFPNSNSTWKARTPLNEFLELFGAQCVNKLHFYNIKFTAHRAPTERANAFSPLIASHSRIRNDAFYWEQPFATETVFSSVHNDMCAKVRPVIFF